MPIILAPIDRELRIVRIAAVVACAVAFIVLCNKREALRQRKATV